MESGEVDAGRASAGPVVPDALPLVAPRTICVDHSSMTFVTVGQMARAVFTVGYDDPRRRLAIRTDPAQRAMEGVVVVRCGQCPQRRELVQAWGMPGAGRPIMIGHYEVSAPMMMLSVGTTLYGLKLVCHPKCGAVYLISSERFDPA